MRQPLAVALQKLDALLVIGEARHDSLAFLMDAVEAFGKSVFHGHMQATAPGVWSGARLLRHCQAGEISCQSCRAGISDGGFTSFADHHNFTEAEAAKLLAHDTPLITTEKDMARLKGAPSDSARAALAQRAAVLPIALRVENEVALLTAIKRPWVDGQTNQTYKAY